MYKLVYLKPTTYINTKLVRFATSVFLATSVILRPPVSALEHRNAPVHISARNEVRIRTNSTLPKRHAPNLPQTSEHLRLQRKRPSNSVDNLSPLSPLSQTIAT